VDDHVMSAAGRRRPPGCRDIGRIDVRAAWQEVSCLPTSGMIFPADALAPADVFAEDFFLDLVDFEWCWRLHQGGLSLPALSSRCACFTAWARPNAGSWA
jgi:GT2 family glycosyltransferase